MPEWVTDVIVYDKTEAGRRSYTWRKRGYRSRIIKDGNAWRVQVDNSVKQNPVNRMMGLGYLRESYNPNDPYRGD